MLRRDRHTPRWAQQRGASPVRATSVPAVSEPGLPVAPGTPAAEPDLFRARPVPIESGPPPNPEQATTETVEVSANAADVRIARPTDHQADLPWPAETAVMETASADGAVAVEPEAPPVPANDVVAGPVVQPIVIGSESTPPLERKRGWWRRR